MEGTELRHSLLDRRRRAGEVMPRDCEIASDVVDLDLEHPLACAPPALREPTLRKDAKSTPRGRELGVAIEFSDDVQGIRMNLAATRVHDIIQVDPDEWL